MRRLAVLIGLLALLPPAPVPAAPGETEPLVLSGRIVDKASRKPIAGALVRPSAAPDTPVRTDAEGRFQIEAPGRRRFEIEALAPGYLPRKAMVLRPQLVSRRIGLLVLERAGALQGTVTDPRGRPLPDTKVVAVHEAVLGARAFEPADPVADQAVTDAQGRFELRLLRAGQSYEVRASRPGSFPSAQRVTIGDPAARPRAAGFVLAPARPVRLKVQDVAGKPVADAEAVLRPALRKPEQDAERNPAPGTARSDPRGLVSIPEAPAAEVEVTVWKKGYAPIVLPALRIPAGTGPADLGVVTLRPGAKLDGRVVDPKGRAVAGAEVFLLRRDVSRSEMERALDKRKPAAATAADGRFVLEDLAQGVPVHLLIRASGYLTGEARGVRPPLAKPVTVRLEPEAVLQGRVVTEDGDPVAGARIDLRWQAFLPEEPDRPVGEALLRDTRSQADGRFEFRDIPRGTVRVSVNAPGFVPLDPRAVDLPRPAEAGELLLVLERGAALQGRVTAASGEPVPGVRVGVGGAAAATNDDGVYWLEGAETGRQEVLFLHPTYGRLVKPFDVQPGINILDVAFDPGVEVTGRVVDESGRPVPGAKVELGAEDRFDLKLYRDVTGEDGRFRLSPVIEGRYRLKAGAEGYTETGLPEAVVVAAEPVAGLELALDRGTLLSGKILGLPPEDLAQVEVEARSDRGDTVTAWTDGRGRYEARALHPGDWTVRATLWDDQRETQARVVIRRSDRELSRDLEFDERLTLTVQVLADEEPLPDARIALHGQRVAVDRVATTDYEGRARIDDLEPDTYRIGVRHDLLIHNGQIDLQEDRDVVIRLQGATVAGLVTSTADGDPIPQALVSLRPVEGPEYLVTAGTRADGSFSLHPVQPGSYRLEARARGFAPATQDLQVAAGQVVDGLELRLKPASGVRLQVRLASGKVPEFVHLQVRDAAGGTVLAETRRSTEPGLFEITMLPPGSYTLILRADGGALVTAPLTVPAAEPLPLTLAPAGRLSLRVSDLVTSDLLGTVRLFGPDRQPFWTIAPGGAAVQQWRLLGGKAFIDGLPAGTWTIQVEMPDGQRWEGAATTSGAGEASATIE